MQERVAEEFESPTDEAQQYLSFMMGGKTYGLAITNIKEIIEYSEITEIPMTPDFMSGVINLRGRVVPVIDLKLRFYDEKTEIKKRTSIIIIEIINDDLCLDIGVTVDFVNEVLDIKQSNIEPAPTMGNQIQTDFISGMAKMGNKLLILLNIENILSVEELSLVGSVQTQSI